MPNISAASFTEVLKLSIYCWIIGKLLHRYAGAFNQQRSTVITHSLPTHKDTLLIQTVNLECSAVCVLLIVVSYVHW